MTPPKGKKTIEVFASEIAQLIKSSHLTKEVDPNKIPQYANMKNRSIVNNILSKLLLPGSAIMGFENLCELQSLTEKNHSGLLLLEHYSNFDLPSFFYLLDTKYGQRGIDSSERIVAMATKKLNNHSDVVRSFAEAYTRIPVYAARDLEKLKDSPEKKMELHQAVQLNRIALKSMEDMKNDNNLVLIFPSGTRYRPGKPESKYPIPQIGSFIKRFDYMIFGGIAGIVLEVDPDGEMSQEYIKRDVIVFALGNIIDCRDYRDHALKKYSDNKEKDAISEAVFQSLTQMHVEAEKIQQENLKKIEGINFYDFPGTA